MKTIKQKTKIYAAATGLGVIVSISIFVCNILAPETQIRLLFAVGALTSGCMAYLWARECKRLKTARLIVENQILHIHTAVIRDGLKSENTEDIEVFVSYFGILLDSKIIKFNQDGVLLKAVEIGRDFISLTYGTDKRMQNTRLLRAAIGVEELEKIAERFRYETGITPVISN